MSASVAYLDTSAFVKLVLAEPETDALSRELAGWSRWMSAALLRTEALRAVGRYGPRYLGAVRQRLAAIDMLRLDEPLLDLAGTLAPPELRSLDVLHLAAALSLGSDLGVFIAYDARLIEAARQQGLPVATPT
jgi:hypothetical protein